MKDRPWMIQRKHPESTKLIMTEKQKAHQSPGDRMSLGSIRRKEPSWKSLVIYLC